MCVSHLYTPSPFTGNLTKLHQIHILITCEHHSSWCADVAMFVSDAASFDTPALSFQTKRSRDEILDDLKRIMKLKPKARLGVSRADSFFF